MLDSPQITLSEPKILKFNFLNNNNDLAYPSDLGWV